MTQEIPRDKRTPFFGCGGFSLVELLIAMGVGLIVLASAYEFFTEQNNAYKVQEQVSEMQQNVRTAMETMVREIRMAGFDTFNATKIAGIVTASANTIRFTQNITSTNPPYSPDTDVLDPNEDITYFLGVTGSPNSLIRYARERTSTSTVSGLQNAVLAENIQSIAFQYYDANDAVTAVLADIRKVEITLVGKTSKPDPNYGSNGGYRTYQLVSQVVPRNL
jgi:type IV pilus assembly protein PilW